MPIALGTPNNLSSTREHAASANRGSALSTLPSTRRIDSSRLTPLLARQGLTPSRNRQVTPFTPAKDRSKLTHTPSRHLPTRGRESSVPTRGGDSSSMSPSPPHRLTPMTGKTRRIGNHIVVMRGIMRTPLEKQKRERKETQDVDTESVRDEILVEIEDPEAIERKQMAAKRKQKAKEDEVDKVKAMINRNFLVDLDSQVVSSRANQLFVGGYYKHMVNKKVRKLEPLPITAQMQELLGQAQIMTEELEGPVKMKKGQKTLNALTLTATFHPKKEQRSNTYGSQSPHSTQPQLPSNLTQSNAIFTASPATMAAHHATLAKRDSAPIFDQLHSDMMGSLTAQVVDSKVQSIQDIRRRKRINGGDEVLENNLVEKSGLRVKERGGSQMKQTVFSDKIESQDLQSSSSQQSTGYAKVVHAPVLQPPPLTPNEYEAANVVPIDVMEGVDYRNFDALKKQIRYQVITQQRKDERKRMEKDIEETGLTVGQLIKLKEKPKKRPLITKRRSFTEAGMKFDDGIKMREAFKKKYGENPIDGMVFEAMKVQDTFPIKEKLLNRPDNFELRLDSFMRNAYDPGQVTEWALFLPEVSAPQNSEDSDIEIDFGSSDNENLQVQKGKIDPMAKFKAIDPRVHEICNWDIKVMIVFPHRFQERQMPYKIMKMKKVEELVGVQQQILDFFEIKEPEEASKKHFTEDMTQLVFEYYCMMFKAAPLQINKFLVKDQATGFYTLRFVNYVLNEPTIKALSGVIPFMVNLDSVEFVNNHINDLPGAALTMAFYHNPTIKSIIFNGQFLKGAFSDTLNRCNRFQTHKIQVLHVPQSFKFIENLEKILQNLQYFMVLTDLNLAGISMSQTCTSILGKYIIFHGQNLRDLNLARCSISQQGTRYIINALNRNTSIRFFNFAYNDLRTQNFEFSIKLGAVITRHANMMHVDVTTTGLKREEVLFLGLALSMSKTMLALHLDGNELQYYDRIFLRTLVAARVGFRCQPLNAQDSVIRNNKEYNQVMHMGGPDNYNPQVIDFIEKFNTLEGEIHEMDFEIQDLMDEIDNNGQFDQLEWGTDIRKMDPQSKLYRLYDRMKERTKKLTLQQEAVAEAAKNNPNIRDVSSVRDSEIQNAEQEALEASTQAASNVYSHEAKLRVERQRQRAEKDVIKEQKKRSQGEMALMFMGINQIASQLLKENPMTGYMTNIILTRVLGYDEIEQGTYWTDCNQCWICSNWSVFTFQFDPDRDKALFTRKIDKMEIVHDRLEKMVQKVLLEEGLQGLDARAELVDSGISMTQGSQGFMVDQIKEVKQQLKVENQESKVSKISALKSELSKEIRETPRLPEVAVEDVESVVEGMETIAEQDLDGQTEGRLSEDSKKIGQTKKFLERDYVEEHNATRKKLHAHLDLNTENPIAPYKTTKKSRIQKMFPGQFKKFDKFKEMQLSHDIVDYQKRDQLGVKQMPKVHNLLTGAIGSGIGNMIGLKGLGQRTRQHSRPASAESVRSKDKELGLKKNIMKSKLNIFGDNLSVCSSVKSGVILDNNQEQGADSDKGSHITSVVKYSRHVRGQATLVERQIFFKGMVYIVEEEVYSDTDNSSIYTSEDEFEVKPVMQKRFAQKFPLMMPGADARQAAAVEASSCTTKSDKTVVSVVSWPSYMKAQKPDAKVDNRAGLTQAQKEYQNKTLPKHYIEKLKIARIEKFDMVESEDAVKRLEKKNRRIKRRLKRKLEDQKKDDVKNKLQEQLKNLGNSDEGFSFEKKQTDVFFVSSACDWLPIKMKTKRILTIEKLNMNENAPPNILNVDNEILIYANLIAPGYHYFYFVQGSIERCFLSPRYPVVRFRGTNVFLNRVLVKPKVHKFESVFVMKATEEEEELFLIDHSVFNRFEIEQMPKRSTLFMQAFEQDVEFSKLIRVCKTDEEELRKLKGKLWEHFQKLSDIFLYEIGKGERPKIGLQDFTYFCKRTNIFDNKTIDFATFDRTFILTNVNTHGYINSAERDLNRYEFLEVIVRLANIKYKEKGHVVKTTVDATQMILDKCVYPNCEKTMCGGWDFRQRQLYNVKVNEFLRKNIPAIEKMYSDKLSPIQTHSKKKYIMLPECRDYIHKMGLTGISEWQIGVMFYESMVLITDTIRSNRQQEMQYWEFLVFISRITFEHYKNTPYHGEHMYLKLDKLLPVWLSPIYQNQTFSFNEEFLYDIKMAKKKERERRRLLGIESDDDDDDDDYDTEDEAEAKKLQEEAAAAEAQAEQAKEAEAEQPEKQNSSDEEFMDMRPPMEPVMEKPEDESD